MRRIVIVLAAMYAGFFIWMWVMPRIRHKEFRGGADLMRGLAVLNEVIEAENHSYQMRRRYATLEALGLRGCQPIGGEPRATCDGFAVTISVGESSYSVRIHPATKARLHSLYADQTGTIRFGTRDYPAGPHSPVLNASTGR